MHAQRHGRVRVDPGAHPPARLCVPGQQRVDPGARAAPRVFCSARTPRTPVARCVGCAQPAGGCGALPPPLPRWPTHLPATCASQDEAIVPLLRQTPLSCSFNSSGAGYCASASPKFDYSMRITGVCGCGGRACVAERAGAVALAERCRAAGAGRRSSQVQPAFCPVQSTRAGAGACHKCPPRRACGPLPAPKLCCSPAARRARRCGATQSSLQVGWAPTRALSPASRFTCARAPAPGRRAARGGRMHPAAAAVPASPATCAPARRHGLG